MDTDNENDSSVSKGYADRLRLSVCAILVFIGISSGVVALPLISNRYGNTDTIGVPLLAFAGWATATGVLYTRVRFFIAASAAIAVAPLTIVTLVALFWLYMIVSSVVYPAR